ncbi:hypothetical protein NHL50_11155 [Acidimicrobiia bacterium EGI L10123]|uniref:glycosyl-4,4'-diaponeurosporenoate acyltransferase CrtO family protein n=1 Tax=Salinilacustrithrix flava TaxID=2957203 RepID=UPI003D7C1521|nr:hypothetical protein [Acidimicrobiia bacterium EGI L10123]
MRRGAAIVAVTTGGAALVLWGWQAFGPRSAVFAFLVVWVPMTWLGTVSRVAQPRLPASYHQLRGFERDGRIYERVGVRAAKRLLRRGPFAFFNPHLHLPAERTPEHLARLEQRMDGAEASHAVLFVATLGVVVHAAARGWWTAAALTLVFDVVMNGYPVMLQRYNRALLRRRYPTTSTGAVDRSETDTLTR